MLEALQESGFFAITLTLAAFCIGTVIQKKWRLAILNPILTGAAMVMIVLWLLDIPVEQYQTDCAPLNYLMTPATICLSIACYDQLQKLRKHLLSIILGVMGGVLSSLLCVWLLSQFFGFDQITTVSLLPKSVTTAIGIAISQQAGGIGALTTAVIVITGILGNVAGPLLCKVFRLNDPVSQGVAYGTASHVVGTSRANEISALAGAVSSLSLTLSGLITTLVLSFLL